MNRASSIALTCLTLLMSMAPEDRALGGEIPPHQVGVNGTHDLGHAVPRQPAADTGGSVPAIDGLFSEWREEHIVARDAKGDATGAFDITKVAVRTNGTELYLHFDIGRELNLQSGEVGDECREAGIVVIGDYNLVGSRKPLDILKTVGLTDLLLRSAVDGTASTWRGITWEESFWPGRLDLLTYDQSVLKPSTGMIVDTTRLSHRRLRELKLNAADSQASDHLMLVADFQFVR